MTNAMKTMLRELLGYRLGNVRQGPRSHSQIVSRADRSAAEALAKLGIVYVVRGDGHGVRAYREADLSNDQRH
jgi:hypothetical protein